MEGHPRGSERRRVYTSCLAILLLTSATINVFLTREVRGLTGVIYQLKMEGRAAAGLTTGQSLPTVEARAADGVKIGLDGILRDKPTVVYVFSPGCKWCTHNLENIKALAAGIKGRYQLIGLSVTDSGLQDYISRTGLTFPVYTIMPSEAGGLSSGTPRTIVVSREGKVIANWFGAYGGDLRSKVEQYFQLALPGVTVDESGSPEPGRLACEEQTKQ